MNKTLIAVLVLIVVILGVVVLMNGKAEAPVVNTPTPITIVTPGPTPAPVPTPTPVAPLKEFTVSAKNFSFNPSTITVKQGDRVKITFQNTEGFHDFKIDGYGVGAKQAQAPATEILEFTADKSGTFEYYCSVGTHRQMGMKGTLTVQSQ